MIKRSRVGTSVLPEVTTVHYCGHLSNPLKDLDPTSSGHRVVASDIRCSIPVRGMCSSQTTWGSRSRSAASSFLLLLSLLSILALVGSCSSRVKAHRTIAYVGRYTNAADTTAQALQPKNKFDLLHEFLLRSELHDLNRSVPDVELELRCFDCRRSPRGADSVYQLIAADSSIIAVIDNTWGVHISAARERIVQSSLPVIAMNADHGGQDFGPASIFSGNSDEVPSDLATYIDRALDVHTINFITEEDYALTQSYYESFNAHNIRVNKEFRIRSSKNAVPDSLATLEESLRSYFTNNPRERSTLLVLNVHSNWGNALLKFVDRSLDSMRMMGHAYIANGDALASFGERTANDLILITNPTDAISRAVHEELTRARKELPDEFNTINAPLFIKRCQDAIAIIRHGIIANDTTSEGGAKNEERKSSERVHLFLSRSQVAQRFASLRNHTLAGSEDLYSFDARGVLLPGITFSRYHSGKLFSMPKQLNAERQIIPNLLFGMEIQDIYDLNISSNSFTADFYYWVKMDTSNRDAEKYISFQNMKSSQSTKELVIESTEGSSIYKLYRVSGNFYVNYNLADFPFDKQELSVNVEILIPDDRMKISFDQSSLLLDPQTIEKYKVTGWNKKAYYVTVDNLITRSLKGDPKGQPGLLKKFKSFAFCLDVERIVLGSFLQIILPLILIGLVAVSLLFIKNLSFENVGEVSVGVFLSIIAFSISLSGMIPSSNYLTRADILFWLTFVVVFGSFMSIIILNSIYNDEQLREYKVRKLRMTLAILYPLLIAWVLFGYHL